MWRKILVFIFLELSNTFLPGIVIKNFVFLYSCEPVEFAALFRQVAFSLARQMWKKILVFIFLELSNTFLPGIVFKNFVFLYSCEWNLQRSLAKVLFPMRGKCERKYFC